MHKGFGFQTLRSFTIKDPLQPTREGITQETRGATFLAPLSLHSEGKGDLPSLCFLAKGTSIRKKEVSSVDTKLKSFYNLFPIERSTTLAANNFYKCTFKGKNMEGLCSLFQLPTSCT